MQIGKHSRKLAALRKATKHGNLTSDGLLPIEGPILLDEAVSLLRCRRIGLIGTSPNAADTIEQWDWRKPSAILIGNEGQGLDPKELATCDKVLRIPHKGTVESLNSAIAAAIILYEASKQRRSYGERMQAR